jgi:hypothetical protein
MSIILLDDKSFNAGRLRDLRVDQGNGYRPAGQKAATASGQLPLFALKQRFYWSRIESGFNTKIDLLAPIYFGSHNERKRYERKRSVLHLGFNFSFAEQLEYREHKDRTSYRYNQTNPKARQSAHIGSDIGKPCPPVAIIIGI